MVAVVLRRNLWVVGSKCTDDTCTKVTQFDPTKSETFEYTSPTVHLDITFGTGRIGGTTGIDNFQIGPFTVKRQTFGLVESEGGHNMHGNIFKVSIYMLDANARIAHPGECYLRILSGCEMHGE